MDPDPGELPSPCCSTNITNNKYQSLHSSLLLLIVKDSQRPPVTEKSLPANSGSHRWLTAREEWNTLTNEDREEESYCWVKMSNNELLLKMYHQLQKTDNKPEFSGKEWISCEYKLLVNGRKENSWHLWTCIKHLVLAIGVPNLRWHTAHSDTMDFRWLSSLMKLQNQWIKGCGRYIWILVHHVSV